LRVTFVAAAGVKHIYKQDEKPKLMSVMAQQSAKHYYCYGRRKLRASRNDSYSYIVWFLGSFSFAFLSFILPVIIKFIFSFLHFLY
jgi:hypothetical protein